MSSKKLLAMMICSLVCLVTPLLYGQATGQFSGTVSDNSGAVVAGAKVTIVAQATNASRERQPIVPGAPRSLARRLRLHISGGGSGFKTAEDKNVRLQVDEQRELNFKLVPGAVTAVFEVNATEVAVETSSPTLGQVITSEQVSEYLERQELRPQLATLTPGTTASTNPSLSQTPPAAATRGALSLSAGGSRKQETDWLLDGNDDDRCDKGASATFSSIDDIQEFKVLTYNYSAEYGERVHQRVS